MILAAKARAFLNKRYNVSYRDIQELVLPSLRHRLILNFEGEASGIDVDMILKEVLERVEGK